MTDGSEVRSDAASDDEATLDVDANGPAAIVATAANVRIAAAAVAAAVAAAAVAAAAAERCRAGRIAVTVAPNHSSSDDPNRSRDCCWRNYRCCYYH